MADGNRFSVRFGASVDRAGVDALGEDVAVDEAAVDRLGVLNGFGNGGRSFFCLVTSPVWTTNDFRNGKIQIHFLD